MYVEYQRFNVFRQPDWRWERVANLLDQYPQGRCSVRDEHAVKQAYNFVRRLRARHDPDQREELLRENPGLFNAYMIREQTAENPARALIMEARLLAGQGFADIAHKLYTSVDTVRWYEHLFFDVVQYLDCRDWITRNILLPAIMRQHRALTNPLLQQDVDSNHTVAGKRFQEPPIVQPSLDSSLKLFAYLGGPILLDLMLTGSLVGRTVMSQDDMEGWLDEHWALSIRRRSAPAALLLPIDKSNVMKLFAIHARIREIDRLARSSHMQESTMEQCIQAFLDDIPLKTAAGDLRKDTECLKDDDSASGCPQ